MSSSSSSSSMATKKVFELGNYKVDVIDTAKPENKWTTMSESSIPVPPPKPLLIGMPCEAGDFPVLLLLHGFNLFNSSYSQLIRHISSHGFIVIAPQFNKTLGQDSSDEIKSAAAITNWLSEPEGLKVLLSLHVQGLQANLSKLALAGHSRGGKVSFALALGKEGSTSLKFSALIGIDPVDGPGKGNQTSPPVLTYVPHSFDLDMAVMVIGSGLGEKGKLELCNGFALIPPCAPKGVNHEDFYNECRKPACYLVAKDYGHLDMLDDDLGIIDFGTNLFIKKGESREPMRKFVGGVVVAFMKAYLEGDSSHLMAIGEGDATLPIELQTVEFHL